jgi:hypothetical protein
MWYKGVLCSYVRGVMRRGRGTPGSGEDEGDSHYLSKRGEVVVQWISKWES